MYKFIQLNEVMKNGETIPVLLHTRYIVTIKQGIQGKDTHIAMFSPAEKHYYYFVRETVEEVWDMVRR